MKASFSCPDPLWRAVNLAYPGATTADLVQSGLTYLLKQHPDGEKLHREAVEELVREKMDATLAPPALGGTPKASANGGKPKASKAGASKRTRKPAPAKAEEPAEPATI